MPSTKMAIKGAEAAIRRMMNRDARKGKRASFGFTLLGQSHQGPGAYQVLRKDVFANLHIHKSASR
jgi:hypothetical protein